MHLSDGMVDDSNFLDSGLTFGVHLTAPMRAQSVGSDARSARDSGAASRGYSFGVRAAPSQGDFRMGIFTKNGNVKTVRYFKAELSRAVNDRLKLTARLPQAEQQFADAVAERRGHLTVESLNDAAIPRDKVDQARGRVEDM